MPGFRIALLLHDRHNDYQALVQADCEQTARRHDLQVSVLSADKSVEAQVRQVRALLAESEATRPRALMICPVSEVALMPLMHDAAKLDVAWVLLSRWTDALHDLRAQYPKVPIFAVLPDHQEIGRIQGRQLRQLLRPGEELVCILGPAGTYSTRLRRAGLEAELADKQGLHWSHFNGDWSEVGGESAMQSWLSTFTATKLPRFVIAGQNDNMAIGARHAFTKWSLSAGQAPRDDLTVLGCDGSPAYGQRLVTSGQLRATVVVPSVSGRAVEEVVKALRFGNQPAAETMVAVRSHPDLGSLVREGTRHR